MRPTLEAQFWSYVERRDPGVCWPWTGTGRPTLPSIEVSAIVSVFVEPAPEFEDPFQLASLNVVPTNLCFLRHLTRGA